MRSALMVFTMKRTLLIVVRHGSSLVARPLKKDIEESRDVFQNLAGFLARVFRSILLPAGLTPLAWIFGMERVVALDSLCSAIPSLVPRHFTVVHHLFLKDGSCLRRPLRIGLDEPHISLHTAFIRRVFH